MPLDSPANALQQMHMYEQTDKRINCRQIADEISRTVNLATTAPIFNGMRWSLSDTYSTLSPGDEELTREFDPDNQGESHESQSIEDAQEEESINPPVVRYDNFVDLI